MQAEELLPCPFCGGPARLWHQSRHGRGTTFVQCDESLCNTTKHGVGNAKLQRETDAIASWNTRAAIAEAAEDLRADAMRSIGELIRTQDNRITDSPIFIVQQKRRVWGIADDYTETFAWVDDDASEHYDDAEKAVRDAERAEDGSSPIEWRQVGYIDIWEFVTACFTEQGCKDYIARDGHNLKQPRIYAAGSYRNNEWRTVRDALIAASKATTPAGPQAMEGES